MPGIIKLVDEGVTRENVVQLATALILAKVASGPKGTGSAFGNAERGMLMQANFAENRIKSGRTFSPDGQKIYSDLAGKPSKTVDDLAGATQGWNH
ncbi:hypothetical protein ACIPZC_19545 [Pseudomonas sp. NPDC089743]|uniref:hypothetical protein n=1 Tax=Pseudomonas sp. NPDC089743 TaxID=3364471 RepID=UPI003801CA23